MPRLTPSAEQPITQLTGMSDTMTNDELMQLKLREHREKHGSFQPVEVVWQAAWTLAIELRERELLHEILSEVKSTREGVKQIMSQLTDLQQAVSDVNQAITDETTAITAENVVIGNAITALGGAAPDLTAITASLVSAKANIAAATANVVTATANLT